MVAPASFLKQWHHLNVEYIFNTRQIIVLWQWRFVVSLAWLISIRNIEHLLLYHWCSTASTKVLPHHWWSQLLVSFFFSFFPCCSLKHPQAPRSSVGHQLPHEGLERHGGLGPELRGQSHHHQEHPVHWQARWEPRHLTHTHMCILSAPTRTHKQVEQCHKTTDSFRSKGGLSLLTSLLWRMTIEFISYINIYICIVASSVIRKYDNTITVRRSSINSAFTCATSKSMMLLERGPLRGG